jgi:hypothetical protein
MTTAAGSSNSAQETERRPSTSRRLLKERVSTASGRLEPAAAVGEIPGPLLPWVLPVAEPLLEAKLEIDRLGEGRDTLEAPRERRRRERVPPGVSRSVAREVARDRRRRRPTVRSKGAPRERPRDRRWDASLAIHRIEHDAVLIGIHHHDHVAVILAAARMSAGRRCRSLDRFIVRHPRSRRTVFFRRVEIHDHEVDRDDAVLVAVLLVRPTPRGGRGSRRGSKGGASSRGAVEKLGVPVTLGDVAHSNTPAPRRRE